MKSYVLSVQFDTKEQAEQARRVLLSLNPTQYKFSAVDSRTGTEVWTERGRAYGAADVRL